MNVEILELLQYIDLSEEDYNIENVKKQINDKKSELESQINEIEQVNNEAQHSELKRVVIDFKDEINNLDKISEILIDNIQNHEESDNIFIKDIKKGDLNQLSTDVYHVNYCLNTMFRDNYLLSTSTNFTMDIPDNIKNVVSMRLSSFEFHNQFYSFSELEGTNTFTIGVDISSVYTKIPIIIPDGNYTSNEMEQTIQSLLDSSINIINGYDIKINIGLTNTKIYNNDISNTIFDIYFENGNNTYKTLGWLLGYRNMVLKGLSSYTSRSVYDSILHKYLFICVDDYNKNCNDTIRVILDNSIRCENILTKINLFDIDYVKVNIREKTHDIRKYNGPVNIQRLGVKIYDMYGDILNYNQDFTFSLDLEIMYSRNI